MVDGGDVEELDRVDEEDSDAGCGFGGHVLMPVGMIDLTGMEGYAMGL